MKSKLLKLTIAVFAAVALNMQAQTPATLGAAIVNNGFENWTGSTPNGWMVAPVTTIAPGNVTQVTTNTLTPVQSGLYSCKMVNTAASYTSGIMGGTGVNVTAGMGYQVSYYARGKGTITCEVTDGSAATSSANYAAANGQSVSGKLWHHFYQTVIAPTTTNNAQFVLKAKSTSTYTTGGVNIVGVEVDSFVVQPYTPVSNVSLYAIQYTALSSTYSPFYAQFVNNVGGIVTGITLSSTGRSGYYIQTKNATQWAAALVFDQTNSPNVALGDSVTFNCAVDEYYSMTELVQVSNFVKVSSGHPVPPPVLVTTQTVAQEMYESILVKVTGATCQTFSANYGQATIVDGSGVPATIDTKSGFYPPNGTSTSGSSGNPGYVDSIGVVYCMTGNVNYEFSVYNIVPRDSADIIKRCSGAGIENYSHNLSANVYPNPMGNELNIKLPFTAQKVSVSFVDVLGKETMSTITSGNEISIKENNLPAGIYLVKIIADGKSQMIKVIKQ